MQLSILAARDARAQERLVTAADALATRFGIETGVTAQIGRAKDPRVAVMQQREAMADLLEAMLSAAMPVDDAITLAQLEKVPGIGPGLIQRIREHMEG